MNSSSSKDKHLYNMSLCQIEELGDIKKKFYLWMEKAGLKDSTDHGSTGSGSKHKFIIGWGLPYPYIV